MDSTATKAAPRAKQDSKESWRFILFYPLFAPTPGIDSAGLDSKIMAQHSSHILDMARKGAEHRYVELKSEIAHLVKHFPHLAKAAVSRDVEVLARGGRAASMEGPTPRKRRKMSAKARKAISKAQKARWAQQKAAKKG
jgi:hypothetical protein